MKNFTLTVFSIALIVSLASCKKDDDATAPPVQSCRLVKFQFDSGYSYSFTYNSEKRITGAEFVYPKQQNFYAKRTFSVVYNAKGQPIEVTNSNYDTLNKLVYVEVTTLEYDASNKVVSYYQNGETSNKYTLTYDSNQRLLRIDWPEIYNGQFNRFEYDGKGNVLKAYTKSVDSAKEVVIAAYTGFDDKKSPFQNQGFVTYLMGFNPYSSNNPKSYKIYEISSTNKEIGTISNEYTYDDKGYPATTHYSTFVISTNQTTTSTGIYDYSCQ